MKLFKIILPVIALVWPTLVFAGETSQVQSQVNQTIQTSQNQLEPVLTLRQAYQLALHNNLKIKAAQAKLPESAADVTTANLIPNPTLMSDLGWAEKTYRVAGLQQTFESPGRRKYRTRTAQDTYQEAIATAQQTTHDVLSDVRKTYNDWIAALAKAQFQKDNLKILQQLGDLAQKRPQKTTVKNLDIDQTTMLIEQAQVDALKAAADIDKNRYRLVMLLNTDQFKAPDVNGFDTLETVHLPTVQQLVDQAYAHRKDLQANAAAYQAEKDRETMYKRMRIPNLNLSAGYDVVNNQPGWVHGIFTMGNINIPLFDRQQGNIAKARSAQNRLLLERRDLEQQIVLDITTQYQQAMMVQQQWKTFHTKLLAIADAVDTEAQDDYVKGDIEINDALGAHANVEAVRLEAIDTYIQYQQSLSDLQTALNTSLGGGHSAPPDEPAVDPSGGDAANDNDSSNNSNSTGGDGAQ